MNKKFKTALMNSFILLLLLAYSQSLQVGLVQGGLEVPREREVTVTMSGGVANHLFLSRYEKLPNELYIEPKNEEIVETFLSEANEEGKQAEKKSWQQKRQQEKKEVRSKNIQDILQNPRSRKGGAKKTIVLDQLMYLEDQLSLCLNQKSFCVFNGRKIPQFWLSKIFSRVIIFVISTIKNISRVFNFKNSTKIRENRDNKYLRKLVPLQQNMQHSQFC